MSVEQGNRRDEDELRDYEEVGLVRVEYWRVASRRNSADIRVIEIDRRPLPGRTEQERSRWIGSTYYSTLEEARKAYREYAGARVGPNPEVELKSPKQT
jgi:hypothetical protein